MVCGGMRQLLICRVASLGLVCVVACVSLGLSPRVRLQQQHGFAAVCYVLLACMRSALWEPKNLCLSDLGCYSLVVVAVPPKQAAHKFCCGFSTLSTTCTMHLAGFKRLAWAMNQGREVIASY